MIILPLVLTLYISATTWTLGAQRSNVSWLASSPEYRFVATTTAKLSWVRSLLTELGVSVPHVSVVYCNNVCATHLCSNLVFHSRMKHVALDYHFIRDQVQSSAFWIAHVSSEAQLANALTKPQPHDRFITLQTKIGLPSWSSILRGHIRECT